MIITGVLETCQVGELGWPDRFDAGPVRSIQAGEGS